MLVTALGMGGCSSQPESTPNGGDTTPAPQTETAQQADMPSDSILLHGANEAAAKLVSDMQAGVTPTECTVLYDQGGELPSVTVTDQKTIGDIYERLAKMTVAEKSNTSITDCYHNVTFTLKDGTRASFNFEGEWLLVAGRENYTVKGGGPLWAYIRNLQAKQMGSDDVFHAINVDDEAGAVTDCSLCAAATHEVKVVCSTKTHKDLHVTMNGEELSGQDIYRYTVGTEKKEPTDERSYRFTMPDSDVELKVTAGQ
jgi:hypothetical protein